MRARRSRVALVAVTVACLAGACAPSNKVAVGVKDYPTDVLYGGTEPTTPPPPPLPSASLDLGFPSFIVSAPPPSFPTVPPPVIVEPDPCPAATPASRVIAAPPTIAGQLAEGIYSYRQSGSVRVGDKTTDLPPIAERRVTGVERTDEGTYSWGVVIEQFGIETTTSYVNRNGADGSSVDGLHITRIVQRVPGKASPDEFTPIGNGLQVLPANASAGMQFNSVAADPVHGATMLLQGTVRDVRRVDVCGVYVEGWAVDATVTVRKPLDASDTEEYTTKASYVVATGLGGLFLAETVEQTGTDRSVVLQQRTSTQLADLAPRRA